MYTEAVVGSATRPLVLPLRETTSEIRTLQKLEQDAGHDRRIGEVRENPVDAHFIKLQVLFDRVAGIVAQQAALLVAERPGVKEQTLCMGAINQIGGEHCRLAVFQFGSDDVPLPGPDAVGVSFDFLQALVSHEETESAADQVGIPRNGPIEGAVEGRGEVHRSVRVNVVGIDQLD